MKKIVLAIILFTLIVNESFILLFVANTMALPVDEASDGFIQSIHIEGSPAYAGKPITVVLIGAPGGKATFTVSGNDTEVKMPEVKDGIYQGMYTVRWEDAIETHYVKARLTIGGNSAEVEEIFQVIRPPIMTSVSVIGSPAKVGDEIIIRVTGKTGARVRADIDKVAYDLPLTEMASSGMAGVYEGKHTVVKGEDVSAAVVTVYFTYKDETIVDKSRSVTIDTIAPEIFERQVDKSPLQNGSNFTLTVGCERGAIVTVDLSQLDTTRGIAFLPEVSDGIFSKVFTISYDNIAINGIKTIEISARDAVGNQSTSELSVELRNPKLNTQKLEVSGKVIAKDNILGDGVQILIYNALSKQEKTSPLAADTSFTVTFADDKHPVAEIGTTIYLSVIAGSDVIANATHQLSSDEILASKTTMDVTITAEPKIDISVEPSILPADGYSLAMVTVTAVNAVRSSPTTGAFAGLTGDAEVEVSASFGFIAPLTEAGAGVWTTTYTAGKTPGAVRLTASTPTASATAELLLTPPDAVAESILIHCPLKRVIVGKTVYIRGMIDPPRFAEPINLEVLEPGGISFVEYTTTGRDGQFSFHIKLNNRGMWRFRASHGRTTSSITEIYAEAEPYMNNRDREWKPSRIVDTTNEINYLLEDNRGNLWAATNYGVMKFEDESWISGGLTDKYVSFLFEDSHDTLWAATAGGVHKLLGDGEWREYSDGIEAKIVVNALFEDSYGALWAATSDGVLRFDGDSWISSGLSGRYVSFLLEDDEGALLAATNDGVSWLDGETWRRYSLLESVVVRSLLKDSRGVLWAATNSGVWRLTDEARRYTRNDGLVSNVVIYLLEDSRGILWAATNSGVCWFDGDRWRPYIYGLGSVVVRCLLEDTHGVLWAATNNGVWKLMDEMWKKYTTRDGLANDFVNHLLAQSDGTLWAATVEGVSKLEGETWKLESEGLDDKSVNYLLEDRDGTLWAATDEGVNRLENGTWRRYGDGLEGKPVNYLLEDGDGTLWAATDEGVSRLENGTWRPYSEGLGDKSVNYLLEDRNGTLLAATEEGVNRLDDGKWRRYSDILENKAVRCLIEDIPGNIWAATDDGVYKREGETWTTKYTVSDGLNSNDVNYLFFDSHFTLWAATHQGVSRFNPNQERWYTDDRLEHDCNYIIEDRHGVLWLATSFGVIRYDANSRAPQTKIEDGPRGVMGQRAMTFRYSGSDIETDRRFLLYSYKLDDSPWSVFSETTSAHISADDGVHTFYVRAMDEDGNIDHTPAKRTFRIDTTQPIAIIEKPAINEVIGGEYSIIGTATDATDFSEYELKISSGETGVNELLRIGKHQVSAGALAIWDTQGKNGVYTIALTVRDEKEGDLDVQHVSATYATVYVDNVIPEAIIHEPLDGQECSEEVTIRGAVKDLNLVGYRIEYTKDEDINPSTEWILIESQKTHESPWEINTSWNSASVGGLIALRLTAIDAASNEGYHYISLRMDNKSPQLIAEIENLPEVIGEYADIRVAPMVGMNIVEYTLQVLDKAGFQVQHLRRNQIVSQPDDLNTAWDTTVLEDGEYALQLIAVNQERLTSTHEIKVTIDHTPPRTEISSPRPKAQVGNIVELIGTATDENFSEYIIEFKGINSENGDWLRASKTPFGRKVQNDTLIKWSAEGRTGIFTLRLTVVDKAQNINRAAVTVDVRPAIDDKIGGETESADGKARLYIPPNSLYVPKIITVNPIEDSIQNTVPPDIIYLGVAYDFFPANLKFKSQPAKPALITISYADATIQPHPNRTVKLYRWQNEHHRWTPIGGAIDVKKREISAAVMELGRYAVMETRIDNGAKGFIDNLTCQPRVFGGVYHSSTIISFKLGGREKTTVKIYNLAGRLKRTLIEDETMNPGINVVRWDGADEDGQKVLSGLYIVVVATAEDKATATVAVLNR